MTEMQTKSGSEGSSTILDGDVLVYQVAHQTAKPLDFGGEDLSDRRFFTKLMLEEALARFFSFVNELKEEYGNPVIVALSGPSDKNFRYDVYPRYKESRAKNPERRPPHFRDIREAVLASDLDVRCEERLEADDLIGLLATPNDIIVSVDKDLKTISAFHVNLRCLSSPIFQSEIMAERFFWKQVVMGDTCDSIPGAKGVGEVKASRAIDGWEKMGIPMREWWPRVVQMYDPKKHSDPEADAIVTARLVHMLRPGEYDWDTGEVTLWEVPQS